MSNINIMLNTLFFELIQVAIGRRDALSRVPSAKEWCMLYGLSVKQAVAGVCFCEVQRMPKEQREEMPRGLMMADGNFGHHDERIRKVGKGKWQSVFANLQHAFHVLRRYPPGGTMDAGMDGVSLCLEKKFENKIKGLKYNNYTKFN